jgi:hypothetical protein
MVVPEIAQIVGTALIKKTKASSNRVPNDDVISFQCLTPAFSRSEVRLSVN